MTAADRIAALDTLPAEELCNSADAALSTLVEIMNRETTLLRAGHIHQAGEISAEKTRVAEDYTVLARAVRRQSQRLNAEAPERLQALRQRHESLATQMAENLRVLATAKTVTQNILSDVAKAVGSNEGPKTYGAQGTMPKSSAPALQGLSINRAL